MLVVIRSGAVGTVKLPSTMQNRDLSLDIHSRIAQQVNRLRANETQRSGIVMLASLNQMPNE